MASRSTKLVEGGVVIDFVQRLAEGTSSFGWDRSVSKLFFRTGNVFAASIFVQERLAHRDAF